LEDRLNRGFAAGIIAGIVMDIWNYFSYYILHLTNMRLLDYASVILTDKKVFILWEEIFFQLAQLFFSGAVGVIFAYLIIKINSRSCLFKSWFFSTCIWFSVFAIASLFKVPYLYKSPTATTLSNFIGASIYGVVLAQLLYWMDNRLKNR